MSAAFEEIAHLAGSENRVRVLRTLAEGPATRQELQDDLAVSQSTASRILADFEDRGWIRRDGGTYEATPLGSIVVRAFTRLVRTMETKDELGDVLEWLPLEGEGLDVADFADATVVLPTPTDLFTTIRYVTEGLEAAAEVRGFASTMAREAFEANWRAVSAGTQRFAMVVTPDILDAILDDPGMEAHLADLVRSERADLYVYDGEIPYTVTLVDGTVRIGTVDEEGAPRALVETEDDRVREWFEARYEAYVGDAREVTPDDLDG